MWWDSNAWVWAHTLTRTLAHTYTHLCLHTKLKQTPWLDAILNQLGRTENVAQWWSVYLAHIRLWIQDPVYISQKCIHSMSQFNWKKKRKLGREGKLNQDSYCCNQQQHLTLYSPSKKLIQLKHCNFLLLFFIFIYLFLISETTSSSPTLLLNCYVAEAGFELFLLPQLPKSCNYRCETEYPLRKYIHIYFRLF